MVNKVFNRKNVKVSYSSMPNFASIIIFHNKKILNEIIAKLTSSSCNCRVKVSYSLDSNCLQSSLIYICQGATPKITNDNPFQNILYKHKNSFKYESKKKTQLSYSILYERTNMEIHIHLQNGKYWIQQIAPKQGQENSCYV